MVKIVAFSDIHSDLLSLMNIFEYCTKNDVDIVVCLGDVVDRDNPYDRFSNSIKCLEFLEKFMENFKGDLYLIYGNHEFAKFFYNNGYGVGDVLLDQGWLDFIKKNFHFYFKFNNILFCHSGFYPGKIIDFDEEDFFSKRELEDFLWSDPFPNFGNDFVIVPENMYLELLMMKDKILPELRRKNYIFNELRGAGYIFNEIAFNWFRYENKVDLVVSGHSHYSGIPFEGLYLVCSSRLISEKPCFLEVNMDGEMKIEFKEIFGKQVQ